MVRVPDWSEAEFESRAAALARLIRRAWRAVARLVAGHVERQAVVTGADAGTVPGAWAAEVEAEILGYVSDTYLDAAGKLRAAIDAPDDLLLTDDLVTAYLRTARNRLRGIGDDVWRAVAAQLTQGVSAGESIPQLAARVRQAAGVSDARSLTIARTEVHAAHEAGSYDQALFVDPEATKIWISTRDARTRETHRAAEGQRRRLSEPFDVGGTQLRYPGDPLGAADEVISCRCTTVYDFGTVDDVPSDAENPELALVAAVKRKWTPAKHPRGADGKFIKKGAVVDFLAKPKPDIPSLSKAVNELTVGSWGKLTQAQREYFQDQVAKLPEGTETREKLSNKLAEMKVEHALVQAAEKKLAGKGQETSTAPAAEPIAKPKSVLPPSSPSAPVVETSTGTKIAKPVSEQGNVIKVGFLLPDGSISAHKGAAPGTPAKITNFVLWGQYPAGTTILESADGNERVTWNGKKYDWLVNGEVKTSASKGAMYKLVKAEGDWVVPSLEGQPVDAPEVLKPDEPADVADAETPETPAPPAATGLPEAPAAPEPEPEPVTPEPAPEPDLLQQLIDDVPLVGEEPAAEVDEQLDAPEPASAPEPTPDEVATLLNKLKTDGDVTPADAVKLGLGMTQDEWNGLTANQRAKLVLGTDLALDTNSIDEGDAYLAFGRVQDLQASQTDPVPEPSPATKITDPEAASEPTVTEQEWTDLVEVAGHPLGAVVAETTDGEFKLVKGHTWNTWYLKDFDGYTIETYTDADVGNGQALADKPFHDWQLTPVATPALTDVSEDIPQVSDDDLSPVLEVGDEIESEADWFTLVSPYPSMAESTVVAQTASGSYRMVAHPDGSVSLEWEVAGKWIDIETFDPHNLDDVESITDLVQSHTIANWVKTEPTLVTPSVPEPASDAVAESEPVPTALPSLPMPFPVSLSFGKTDTQLDGYTAFEHPVGTTIAQLPAGHQQLVAEAPDAYVLQVKDAAGNWTDGAHIDAGMASQVLQNSAWQIPDVTFEQAVQPASLPAPQLGAPAIKLPENVTFQSVESLTSSELIEYIAFEHPPGTILGLQLGVPVAQRIVATGLVSPRYKMQHSENGVWVDDSDPELPGSEAKQELAQGGWLLPKPTVEAVHSFLASFKKPKPVPEPGSDTGHIPLATKKAWKKKLGAAKVGYWSAPEKIWDQIKQIQDQYPDPDNPGHSKVTPLQVLKALDEVYTGKEVSPYETKMIKWAASAKGKAYTGNTGSSTPKVPDASAATQVEAPPAPQMLENNPANVEKLWNALGDLDDGAVLAIVTDVSGINGTLITYQFVVSTDPATGTKLPKLQYKNNSTGIWSDNVAVQHLFGWQDVLEKPISGQPWKLNAVQQPVGGVPAATVPASPSAPSTAASLANTDVNAGKVWTALPQLADGTIVASNPGGEYGSYQAVVATVEGQKQLLLQSKSKKQLGSDWKTMHEVTDVTDFQDLMTDTMGGNPWVFNVGEDALGGAPSTSAAPGPPVPQPFKATVKQLYAAMPTLKLYQPVALGEFNGEKYQLVPGYGITKKGYSSKKKKLILKKQSAYGGWQTVDYLDTQPKLAAVIKDPKYGWVVPEETPAMPPPSVPNPVAAPKPTPSASSAPAGNAYTTSPDDLNHLWDNLSDFGTDVTIAAGFDVDSKPAKLVSQVDSQSNVKVFLKTASGSQLFAEHKQQFLNKLGASDWKITATKSPLFGSGEIAHVSETQKQDLYAKFKKQPSTYLDSPSQDIYAALSTIASDSGISLLQMIRVIDEVGAQKVNKPDAHLFEKKIKDWLATPQGAAVASGKPIPLPPTPAFSSGYGYENIPSFEASSGLNYEIVSAAEANQLWSQFTAKTSPWTSAQQSSLKAYTGGIYYSINAYHYGKLPDLSESNLKAAQNAQKGMRPSTVPLLLHRGVGYDGIGGATGHASLEKMVGQTWKSGGFFSTSVGGQAAFSSYPVAIEIEAPPGTPMAYLKPISNFSSENEMLLAAGLSYRIISVQLKNGKSVVRVRVVPPVPEED